MAETPKALTVKLDPKMVALFREVASTIRKQDKRIKDLEIKVEDTSKRLRILEGEWDMW